ncbi:MULTISPECIES: RCC1 domain-containing protein [Myxococcus]|uniref:RCC1 domain-containing protein n=1 Tax=Myxococcus TaxID=32 RepID=UPI0011414B6D|nr:MULTISPECIES: chromosome condensation regulator RCC1 [Myxococcus]MCK8503857.1 chromosome condensation regulator RCC1 [Myxococcus fulvus]
MKSRACVLALAAVWLAACGADVETTPGVPVAPYVQLHSHVSGASAESAQVKLQGSVSAPGRLAELTARLNGGEPRAVEFQTSTPTSASFTLELTLVEGDNDITLAAVDQTGARTERTLALRFDEAPVVQVRSPREGVATTVRRMRVEFTATDNVAVTQLAYTLNDGAEQALTLPATAGEPVSFEVTPRAGRNTVVLHARDAAGNEAEQAVSFHFGQLASAGGLHSGTLKNGRVYTWGRNNRGQLGLGDDVRTDQTQPQPVPGLENATAIAFNQNFAMALTADGSVWSWGENNDSQLGLSTPPSGETPGTPDVTPRYVATRIPHLTGAVSVANGFRHALILMEDGTVQSFGNNANGQLGDGTTVARGYPMPVQGLTNVVKVLGGSMHSVALKADGTVWVWGRNDYGNLGTGVVDGDSHPLPGQVPGITDVVDIANGRDHILAVHKDGTVSAWGLDATGQLGTGALSAGGESATPVKVKGVTDATAVFANGNYSFARRADGSLLGWGSNFNGQLGIGIKETNELEARASSGTLTPLTAMGMGATHVIAVREDGSVFAWGWNLNGSLGPDGVIDRWSYTDPIPVPLP